MTTQHATPVAETAADHEPWHGRSEMDALGHPVPTFRRAAGYRAVREMAPEATPEQATMLVDKVCQYIERDMPYEAQRWATFDSPLPIHVSSDQTVPKVDKTIIARLDLVGGLRLFAILLTGEPQTAS